MTDEQWSPWITHNGGPCPIRWAKAGEYKARYRTGEVPLSRVAAKSLAGGLDDWWRHEGAPGNNIIAYRYLLSAAPPGWTPPRSADTAPRDDLAAMQPQPIKPDQPTFAENAEAGLRIFKVGDRPHIAERHDGYDLLLDMETRALVGVQWPIQAKEKTDAR